MLNDPHSFCDFKFEQETRKRCVCEAESGTYKDIGVAGKPYFSYQPINEDEGCGKLDRPNLVKNNDVQIPMGTTLFLFYAMQIWLRLAAGE